MKKIGIIGNFKDNKKILNGQTIKTLEINKYIETNLNISTYKLDTHIKAKNPFVLLFNIIKILKENDVIIVILYTRGYKIIAPILTFFNKFYKKRIYDFVVGGKRYEIYKNNNYMSKVANSFNKIYVETDKIKKEYKTRNINNVDVISNFKFLKNGVFKKTNKNKIKLCVFSRILKEKGIEESIKSVILANEKIGKNVFILDIYGPIDSNYNKEFEELLKNSPDYIRYCKEVYYDKSVDTLNKYDGMLFLTYYKNEGFPGSIIDALYSGLFIIATDWNYNFEILKNNYNAIKVNIKDINNVSEELINLYNNINIIDSMKKNSLKESEKYIPNKIMKNFLNEIKRN